MDSQDNYSRPALKEITANETASGTLSANNQKQLAAKPYKHHQQDISKLDAVNTGFGENSNTERKSINLFAGGNESLLDSNSLELPLDILQPQIIHGQSQPSLEDSFISSLAANLDTALPNTTGEFNRSESLLPPHESESSSSHVSSDNETYVECRPFSPENFHTEESSRFTSALDSITDPSHGWADLVTSVSELNMDSLENTNEQLEIQLDMTPTELTNPSVLNFTETPMLASSDLSVKNAQQSGTETKAEVKTAEEKVMENQDNINTGVITCTTPEKVVHKVANLIENVDTNSSVDTKNDSAQEQELMVAVPSTDVSTGNVNGLSVSLSATGIEDELEYCSNVTVEADKVFALDNKSNASKPSMSVDTLNVIKESNAEQSNVLSWEAVQQNVEKLYSSTSVESVGNLTQSSPSSSSLKLNVGKTSPQGGIPLSPSNSVRQFPIKTTSDSDKTYFPKSPTNCHAPPEFPTVSSATDQSQESPPSDTKLVKDFNPNETIDIIPTSPSGLNRTTTVGSNSGNPMDSTFTANPEIFDPTTTVLTAAINQTTEITPSRSSISPTISNRTINLDQRELDDSDRRSVEPMDVDMSPSPNKTVSYAVLSAAASNDSLSEKEKSYAKDEKDVFVECATNDKHADDDEFKNPQELVSRGGFIDQNEQPSDIAADEDFQSNRLFLNPSDFDFLLTKGNSNVEVDRSSLLLRFDPLLGHSVPVNQPVKAGSFSLSALTSLDKQQQQHQQEFTSQNRLSPTNEEEEQFYTSNRSFRQENGLNLSQTKPTPKRLEDSPVEDRKQQQKPLQITARSIKKNVKMSVDVIQDMKIENDCKSIEEIDTQTDEKQNFKMDELQKKIKNEVLKTEDIEKKLKEAEQREEALIKRITEKDKTLAKMNGVIEAYEKAIAELIAEKEEIIQNHEKELTQVKTDRDSFYNHLTSLEQTFSDLHFKYEKSKEMTIQLKNNEETLRADKRQNIENLRLQEQRYEKMKNHAMQQLEIANKKLESLTRNHSVEITKLKALLKKEEISRASINEQLQQKSRENEELVKICDELINGQGS